MIHENIPADVFSSTSTLVDLLIVDIELTVDNFLWYWSIYLPSIVCKEHNIPNILWLVVFFACTGDEEILLVQLTGESNPIVSLHQINFSTLKDFVNEFAAFFIVSTFSSNTFFLSIISLMKWYCTSMCFILEWYAGLFFRKIALWLSQKIPAGCWPNPISEN